MTIHNIHKPAASGNAVFQFAEEITVTDRAEAPIRAAGAPTFA